MYRPTAFIRLKDGACNVFFHHFTRLTFKGGIQCFLTLSAGLDQWSTTTGPRTGAGQ